MASAAWFVSAIYLTIFNLLYPVLWYTSLRSLQLIFWLLRRPFPRGYTDLWAIGWGLGQIMGVFFVSRTRIDLSVDPKLRKHTGPFLVVMNHQTSFDIGAAYYIAYKLGRRFRWVLKKELLKAPFVGAACYETRCAFVDRHDRPQAEAEIRRFAAQLKEDGVCGIIFVEGTRATPKKLETSPFRNLLAPKTLGLSLLHQELPDWPILSVTLDWQGKAGTTIARTSIWRSTLKMDCKFHDDQPWGDDISAWLQTQEWPRYEALIEAWKESSASPSPIAQTIPKEGISS